MQICIFLIIIMAFSIIIQYRSDIKTAYKRLEDYNIKTIETEFGMMTYVDEGTGEAVLISHGIFGGYDQGFVSLNQVTGINYRKISISRFGYPGSELPRNPTPENQAKVFNKLLDELGIEQAYILATSAGGAAGLRFALNYPERVKGLILLSSGVPDKQRSTKEIKELGMMGPPEFLVNDFPMWFSMKYFGFIFDSMMGSKVNSSTLFETMLPVSPRRQGIIMDTNITNIDMTLHYDEYPIEKLKSPVLVIHAKDDPMAKYENIEKLLARIEAETAIFETGGHTIDGNDGEVNKAIEKFIDKTK
ncbi:alpha/beta hydrolase [uncultured Tissierella sp.]|uniref:alpha/beta fold hydrolase n=1 Tax=uncultured Tissierella sp. TaxID=448160 RepID=UPI0028048612|nr:alpha/beta hydrolase [uncultured Tissierella sp.]MDU5080503.1 alpha/beta hydrolase [Bacillota bacterium]